jgi:hypothetical protein
MRSLRNTQHATRNILLPVLAGALSVALLISCDANLSTDTAEMTESQAYAAQNDALNAFYAAADAADASSGRSLTDGIPTRDRILALAIEAGEGGSADKLEKTIKDAGLWDDYLAIRKDYDLDAADRAIAAARSVARANGSYTVNDLHSFKNGTVFLYTCGSSSSSSSSSPLSEQVIPGKWKHAQIRSNRVQEKMPNFKPEEWGLCGAGASGMANNSSQGVGYIKTASVAPASMICAVYAAGAGAASGEAVVNYVHDNFNEGYWILPWNRETTDSWYCSKMAWLAWKAQGFDMDNEKALYPNDNGKNWVYLAQFMADSSLAQNVGLDAK